MRVANGEAEQGRQRRVASDIEEPKRIISLLALDCDVLPAWQIFFKDREKVDKLNVVFFDFHEEMEGTVSGAMQRSSRVLDAGLVGSANDVMPKGRRHDSRYVPLLTNEAEISRKGWGMVVAQMGEGKYRGEDVAWRTSRNRLGIE